MQIEIKKIQEPLLEFGGGNTNPFIKDALLKGFGPYESTYHVGTKKINLGIVGPTSEIEPILRWLESIHKPIVSNETNALRFREFPGVERAMRARFSVDERHVRDFRTNELQLCLSLQGRERFEALLELYCDRIQSMFTDSGPDCILVQFPEEVASMRIANGRLSADERSLLERLQEEDSDTQLELFEMTPDQKKLAEELLPQAEELLFRSFHRALKSKCMQVQNCVPLQILRERTYFPDSNAQSPSTIAWNVGLGIYYKAGNVPWKLHDMAPDVCFVGVSFHYLKRRAGDLVYASVAQAFSSSGEGFALKGETIPKDQTRNKRPFLKENQSADLISKVLEYYRQRNGSYPVRVVVHKTSHFQPEEEAGFKSGILNKTPQCELVWLIPSGFRLLRRGFDPPERGTLCTIEKQHSFLFTTGYVNRWNEYPGPHIPSPLQIGSSLPEDLENSARDILALTKMNWNSAEGLGRNPITLSFARRVGIIMTEMEEETVPNPSYRFYM